MQPVHWCNICQKKPATGSLLGYFANLKDEEITLLVCTECAEESLANRE